VQQTEAERQVEKERVRVAEEHKAKAEAEKGATDDAVKVHSARVQLVALVAHRF
jgi:hypothetical protein